MYRKNTAGQFLGFAAVKAADGTAMTGTTGFAAYRVLDGAQATATGTVTDKANGQYSFALSQADTNGNDCSILFVMTGMVPVEKTFITTVCDPTSATNFGMTALPAVASGSAGAVLVDGTGTAAIANSSGKVLLQATQTGVTIPTVTTVTTTTNLTNAPTSGDLTATMKTSVTTAATAATPTAAAVTGAVGSVTGAVGSVTGSVGSVTGAVGSVTGSVGSVTGAVGSVTGNIGGIAGVTLPATVASPTNITAGVITTVTNLTNAAGAGDLTAAMKTSVTTAATASTPTVAAVTDKTGFSLAATGLNLITATDPAGVATTFPAMLVQLWRRFYGKSAKNANAGTIVTYKDDGTTAETTQAYTDDGSGNETMGAAS